MATLTNETIIWIFIQIMIILLFLRKTNTERYYITYIGCVLLFTSSLTGIIVLDNTTGTKQLLVVISMITVLIYIIKITIQLLDDKNKKRELT